MGAMCWCCARMRDDVDHSRHGACGGSVGRTMVEFGGAPVAGCGWLWTADMIAANSNHLRCGANYLKLSGKINVNLIVQDGI